MFSDFFKFFFRKKNVLEQYFDNEIFFTLCLKV